MGPRDVAVIPIDSLPAWAFGGTARSVVAKGGSGLEVLAVLRDPRDVPLERFLYALTDDGQVLVHPEADAIRQAFDGQPHSAVAVYVRVSAPAEICEECSAGDPFYVSYAWFLEEYPDSADLPWDTLGVSYAAEGVSALPCLEPMTIESNSRALVAPDTGGRVRPDEYLPPRPQYAVKDNTSTGLAQGEMTAGEVREGWVLCLAPDVPADHVSIVEAYRERQTGALHVRGSPLWAPVEEMAVGQWFLLEDQRVMGWHEDPTRVRDRKPVHLDEQGVYEGDVWVSVSQALRYVYPGSDGAEDRYSQVYALQLAFDGMDELLQVWDDVGLQDELDLTMCADLWSLTCGPEHRVRVEARGRESWIGPAPHYGLQWGPVEEEVVWIHPGSVRQGGVAGRLPAWRVGFQDVRVEDVGLEAVCAATKCLQGVGDFPETVVSYPVIAAGDSAFGLTVKSARFVSGEILAVDGLDVYLDMPSTWMRPEGEHKWLVVEVEAEGVEYALSAWNVTEAEGGISSWRGVDYGMASGYQALGSESSSDVWSAYTRAGRVGTVMASEVPADWRLADIVLIAGGTGPAWELPE